MIAYQNEKNMCSLLNTLQKSETWLTSTPTFMEYFFKFWFAAFLVFFIFEWILKWEKNTTQNKNSVNFKITFTFPDKPRKQLLNWTCKKSYSTTTLKLKNNQNQTRFTPHKTKMLGKFVQQSCILCCRVQSNPNMLFSTNCLEAKQPRVVSRTEIFESHLGLVRAWAGLGLWQNFGLNSSLIQRL